MHNNKNPYLRTGMKCGFVNVSLVRDGKSIFGCGSVQKLLSRGILYRSVSS